MRRRGGYFPLSRAGARIAGNAVETPRRQQFVKLGIFLIILCTLHIAGCVWVIFHNEYRFEQFVLHIYAKDENLFLNHAYNWKI